jgi:PIN domain nuclease of toxin-antitoxin system
MKIVNMHEAKTHLSRLIEEALEGELSLGKLALATTLEQLVRGGVERGVRLLDVSSEHAYLVERLPFHHRDPFDRLLVAQAMHEGMHLISAHADLDRYPVTRVWSWRRETTALRRPGRRASR